MPRKMPRTARVLLVLITMVLVGWQGGNTATGATLGPSCYPHNEFSIIQAGAFTASSDGSAEDVAGTIEIPPADSGIAATAKSVTWSFAEQVTGNATSPFDQPSAGSMRGRLEIRIKWSSPSLPDTVFVSDCIAEAQADNEDQEMEAELEGTVTHFPYQAHPRRAVAAVSFEIGEFPHLKFKISIELGTTCFEQLVVDSGLDEFEINLDGDNGVGHVAASVPHTSGTVGRAALPDGFTPSEEPCPGVSYFDD